MYSDDSYHSESEFYYPDELNVEENQPISASTSHIENDKTVEIASDIEDFILSKRPENTMKKTKYDMNIWKNTLIPKTTYEILKISQPTS